jgi:hypothetical protein
MRGVGMCRRPREALRTHGRRALNAARAARRATLAECLVCAIVGTTAAAPAIALTRYTVMCGTATVFAGPTTRTPLGTVVQRDTVDAADRPDRNGRTYGYAWGSVNQWAGSRAPASLSKC